MRVKGDAIVRVGPVEICQVIQMQLDLERSKVHSLQLYRTCYDRDGIVRSLVFKVAELPF